MILPSIADGPASAGEGRCRDLQAASPRRRSISRRTSRFARKCAKLFLASVRSNGADASIRSAWRLGARRRIGRSYPARELGFAGPRKLPIQTRRMSIRIRFELPARCEIPSQNPLRDRLRKIRHRRMLGGKGAMQSAGTAKRNRPHRAAGRRAKAGKTAQWSSSSNNSA